MVSFRATTASHLAIGQTHPTSRQTGQWRAYRWRRLERRAERRVDSAIESLTLERYLKYGLDLDPDLDLARMGCQGCRGCRGWPSVRATPSRVTERFDCWTPLRRDDGTRARWERSERRRPRNASSSTDQSHRGSGSTEGGWGEEGEGMRGGRRGCDYAGALACTRARAHTRNTRTAPRATHALYQRIHCTRTIPTHTLYLYQHTHCICTIPTHTPYLHCTNTRLYLYCTSMVASNWTPALFRPSRSL